MSCKEYVKKKKSPKHKVTTGKMTVWVFLNNNLKIIYIYFGSL